MAWADGMGDTQRVFARPCPECATERADQHAESGNDCDKPDHEEPNIGWTKRCQRGEQQ